MLLTLADLIADLRIDLADPGATLFVDSTLERCVRKAVFRIARDLKQSIGIVAGEIVPEIDGETREIILIVAQVHACQVMRSATANAFSFSSGDKRVDKTKQPEHWANALSRSPISRFLPTKLIDNPERGGSARYSRTRR